MDPRSSSDSSRIGDVPGKPCAEPSSARPLVGPRSKAEVREANEVRLLGIAKCRQDSVKHAHKPGFDQPADEPLGHVQADSDDPRFIRLVLIGVCKYCCPEPI
jgi:hypothetical protein